MESIGDYAFAGCGLLESVRLPESLTNIGRQAFSNCSALKNITVPGGVKRIKNSTFFECRSLEEVTLQQGIKDLDEYAFWYCSKLQRVRIFTGLEFLYFNAFADCPRLSEVIFDGKLYHIRGIQDDMQIPYIVRRIAYSCRPRKDEIPRALSFPSGYPYMDEFEYLNSGGEED